MPMPAHTLQMALAHHAQPSTQRAWRAACCLALMAAAGTPALAQFSDQCASAPSIAEGVFTFDLSLATPGDTPFTPSCAEDRDATIDQWVRYVPTFTGPIEISTLGLSSGDTVLSVHEDFCDFAPFLVNACSDDASGTPQSRVVMTVSAGQPMLIRIAGALGSRPSGSVSIAQFTPPPGDACDTALPATTGPNTYDATLTVLNNFVSCSGYRDTFFTYTPAFRGGLTVSDCDGPAPANISIFTACEGSTLACSEYAECFAATAVEAGVPIIIRIANDAATGPQSFTISLDPNAIPTNDSCGSPLSASLGANAFDNTFATTEAAESCAGGPFPFTSGLDVYFSFIPAETGIYDISTEESLGLSDTQLSIADSCFDAPFACNDDARGFLSFIRTPLTAGQSYSIRISGSGLPNGGTPIDRGLGSLTIRRSIPPTNDSCETAQTVTAGLHNYNIYDASTGMHTPSCLPEFVTTGNDVWFRFVSTATGPVEAALEPGGDAGSLSVFTSCDQPVSTDTAATYFDPATGVLTPRLMVNGEAGVPILFRVAYSYFGDTPLPPTGAGQVYIGAPRQTSPVNDSCANALPLASGETFFTLDGSTKDCNASATPQSNPCVGVTDNDIFYRFTAAASGPVVIGINDGVQYPEFAGIVVSVLDSCTSLPLACSFELGNAPAGEVQFVAQAGQEYLVRVGSVLAFGSSQVFAGSITLQSRNCGTSDYNGDGDFGTDQDIEAFFACLGGNCCATCFSGGSDFNGDGDFGTDQDIESFFRVLGGGSC
jgi:hypothetical protein